MKDPRLVIRTDSWHYRYWLFIRSFWGKGTPPQRTSLCPYCQTMLWFSVGAIALSPAIILGWLLLKTGRLTYKALFRLGFTGLIDFVDDSFYGKGLETLSEETMSEAPGVASLGSLLLNLSVLALAALVLGAICTIIYGIIKAIPLIPMALCTAVLCLGTFFFHLFVGIGCALHVLASGAIIAWGFLAWLFTNGQLWANIGTWIAISFGVGFGSIAIVYALCLFSRTRLAQWLWDRVVFKLNGYATAKAEARVLREKKKEEKMKTVEPAPVHRGPGILLRTARWFKRFLFEDVNIGGKATRTLGAVGTIWTFAWAVKRQICPLVEFEDIALNQAATAAQSALAQSTLSEWSATVTATGSSGQPGTPGPTGDAVTTITLPPIDATLASNLEYTPVPSTLAPPQDNGGKS